MVLDTGLSYCTKSTFCTVQCKSQITGFAPLAFVPDVFTKTDQRQTHPGAGHGIPVTREQYQIYRWRKCYLITD